MHIRILGTVFHPRKLEHVQFHNSICIAMPASDFPALEKSPSLPAFLIFLGPSHEKGYCKRAVGSGIHTFNRQNTGSFDSGSSPVYTAPFSVQN